MLNVFLWSGELSGIFFSRVESSVLNILVEWRVQC